jgi:opacity protein-like surface antigen
VPPSRILLALFVASPLISQEAPSGLAIGDRFVEANVGFSWYSPRGNNWGLIGNRRVYLSGLRGEWVLQTGGRLALAYIAEWVPLAVVERTSAHETLNCYQAPRSTICEVDRSVRVAVGTGASPVGLKMYLNHAGSTRVFASASGGMIAFSSDVPVRSSRRLNFMFDYGGGVDFVLRDGRAATLGYRFHHISNAGSARVNPGLDANILYVGLRRKR